MLLRLARPADAEALRAIYNVEVLRSTATFDVVPRTMDEQREWMAVHQGAHAAVVAEDQGGPVLGFGSLSYYRDRPGYATSVEDSVYVADAARGRGVGRAILEELIQLAEQHGFHTLVAHIESENTPSITLHRTCGFKVVGIEREIGRKFNRWLDVTVLQHLL